MTFLYEFKYCDMDSGEEFCLPIEIYNPDYSEMFVSVMALKSAYKMLSENQSFVSLTLVAC